MQTQELLDTQGRVVDDTLTPFRIVQLMQSSYPGRYDIELTRSGLRFYPDQASSARFSALVEVDPVEGEEGTWRCRVWRIDLQHDRHMRRLTFGVLLADEAPPYSDTIVPIDSTLADEPVRAALHFLWELEDNVVRLNSHLPDPVAS